MLDKVEGWMKEQHMLNQGDRIVVGVSGGADSVALLLVLLGLKEKYRLTLFVVHVNHGIRGEAAARDAEYVRGLCERYHVPFFLYEASVPELAKKWQMSLETAGREYRYQCFLEAAGKNGADCVATAHHMGDQAETLLFHLARGTNLAGGAGIRPVGQLERDGKEVRLIRPLLHLEKEELIAYLKGQGITWCEDATNEEDSYTRNKIRNRVLPVLQEINGQATGHIAQFASLLGEYEAFFSHFVEAYMEEQVFYEHGCETNREKLLQQEPLLVHAVLYQMIISVSGQKKDITREHIVAVKELLGAQSGKRVCLPYEVEAVASYDKLIVRKLTREEQPFFDCTISLEQIRNKGEELRLSLPDGGVLFVAVEGPSDFQNISKNVKNNYTKVFDCDTIKGTLHIRNPQRDDYIVIREDGSRKRIARYFIDEKIPSDNRSRQLLVTVDNEVLWHIGGRRGERYKVCGTTEHILRLRYEGGYDEGAD